MPADIGRDGGRWERAWREGREPVGCCSGDGKDQRGCVGFLVFFFFKFFFFRSYNFSLFSFFLPVSSVRLISQVRMELESYTVHTARQHVNKFR